MPAGVLVSALQRWKETGSGWKIHFDGKVDGIRAQTWQAAGAPGCEWHFSENKRSAVQDFSEPVKLARAQPKGTRCEARRRSDRPESRRVASYRSVTFVNGKDATGCLSGVCAVRFPCSFRFSYEVR